MRKPAVFPLIVLAAGIIISIAWYARSLTVGFLADDYDFLEHVTAAEMHPQPVLTLARASIGGASFFRPVINLSFWSDYQLFRYQPTGYHLSNLLIFGLSLGLTVLIVEKLSKSKLAALVAGLFFLVNPFASESVTWIAGRTDLWMLAGLLFALYSFIRYRDKSSPLWFAMFVLGGLITLLSKENGIVFLPLVFIIDLFFFRAWRTLINNIRSRRTIFLLALPYLFSVINIVIFFLIRRQVLGFLLANTNSYGNSYFTYPALSDLKSFVQYLTVNIFSSAGFSWLPVARKFILGAYALGFLLVFFRLISLSVRRQQVWLKPVFFGILVTLVLALPISGYFSFVGPDHSNIRFLYVPAAGIFITLGMLFGITLRQSGRALVSAGFLAIFIIWSVGAWQGQSRFVMAHAQMEKVYSSFDRQIRPSLASPKRPGLLIANLPGLRNGVHVTPANINFALGLRFPETIKTDIQMYGILPIADSLLCQLADGTRGESSVISYVWKNDDFTPSDLPDRFLSKPQTPGVQLTSLKTGVADTSFPFVVITGYKLSWINSEHPIKSTGLRRLIIPIQAAGAKLPSGQPHIRFGFSETAEIGSDDIVAIPITQTMLDQGKITLDLCQYPRFFQFTDHRAFSWEWRNLGNLSLTVDAPRFE